MKRVHIKIENKNLAQNKLVAWILFRDITVTK